MSGLRWVRDDGFDELGRRIATVSKTYLETAILFPPNLRLFWETWMAGEALLDDDGEIARFESVGDAMHAADLAYAELLSAAGDPADVAAFPALDYDEPMSLTDSGMQALAYAVIDAFRPRRRRSGRSLERWRRRRA